MRCYEKTQRRFIVKDVLSRSEGRDRPKTAPVELLEAYNETKEARYNVTPPLPKRIPTPKSRSVLQDGDSNTRAVSDETTTKVLRSKYSCAVMLPPFQGQPFLPPALKIKTTFYSSPALSLKFNAYLPENPSPQPWSGERLLASSHEWAARQRRLLRERLKGGPVAGSEAESVSKDAFVIDDDILSDTLEALDLLITVAHCSHCHDHVSLRHDCTFYKRLASDVLLAMAAVVVDYNPEARVGLLRLKRCQFDADKVRRKLVGLGSANSPVVRPTKVSEIYKAHSASRLEEQQRLEKLHDDLTPKPSSRSSASSPPSRALSRRSFFPASPSSSTKIEVEVDEEDAEDERNEEAELSTLSQSQRGSFISSRRFRSRVPLGAFEVQVSYRQANGRIVSEVIHSKLALRQWPSDKVLASRLVNFLASYVTCLGPSSPGAAASTQEEDGQTASNEAGGDDEEGGEEGEHVSAAKAGAGAGAGTEQPAAGSAKGKSGGEELRAAHPPLPLRSAAPTLAPSVAVRAAPYCAYPDTCSRGCRRGGSDLADLSELATGGSRKGRGSAAVGTKLLWVADQTSDATLHEFAVGDVVDVLMVAPVPLSPRRHHRGGARQAVATASKFCADRGSVSEIQPVRAKSPLARGTKSCRSQSPSSPSRRGGKSPIPSSTLPLLWAEQGFLRGSVTSTHRDGTYDVAYWPSRRSEGAKEDLYEPLLNTRADGAAASKGKTAVEGYVEKGVPAAFVRGMQDSDLSVLTRQAEHTVGDDHHQSFSFCFTADQLRRARRPWAAPSIESSEAARGPKAVLARLSTNSDDDEDDGGDDKPHDDNLELNAYEEIVF